MGAAPSANYIKVYKFVTFKELERIVQRSRKLASTVRVSCLNFHYGDVVCTSLTFSDFKSGTYSMGFSVLRPSKDPRYSYCDCAKSMYQIHCDFGRIFPRYQSSVDLIKDDMRFGLTRENYDLIAELLLPEQALAEARSTQQRSEELTADLARQRKHVSELKTEIENLRKQMSK
jgi:hypothetical protein